MSDDKQAGYCKQWVSGPRQVTKQVCTDDGLLGSFTLVLYWRTGQLEDEPDRVLLVDFELFEVTAVRDDGTAEYHRRDSTNGWDTVSDLGEADWTAQGFVKSDGCTQFEVSAVHVDHIDGLHRLLGAIATARHECAMAMPGSDVILEYAGLR